MIQFKNIRISKRVIEKGMALPFIYFEDDKGRDWYTLRDKTWTGKTAFIAVAPDGFITTGALNPNFLTLHEGLSVYEINAAYYQADIGSKPYVFKDGKITAFTLPPQELAGITQNELLIQATKAIAPLQDAVDVGIATGEETELLTEWKRFRVMVSRVDTTLAPDIEWPVTPDTK